MHKHLQAVENKDWAAMQAYFEWNKKTYAPALEAMKAYPKLDFHKMFIEDSDLFVFFVRIHSEKGSYDVEKFWSLHYEAYQQLKSDGVVGVDYTEDKLKIIRDFEAKLEGPCLLSREELEETMTVKKKKGHESIHFDFHEVLGLIEERYDINVRGIFDKLKHNKQQEIFSQYFSDYEKFSRLSPVDSLEANYISIISDSVSDQFEYIDFWHYLTDSDFCEVSNGSLCYMGEPSEINVKLEDIINTKEELQKYVSNKIKAVFFKELSQLKELHGEDSIAFWIEW